MRSAVLGKFIPGALEPRRVKLAGCKMKERCDEMVNVAGSWQKAGASARERGWEDWWRQRDYRPT